MDFLADHDLRSRFQGDDGGVGRFFQKAVFKLNGFFPFIFYGFGSLGDLVGALILDHLEIDGKLPRLPDNRLMRPDLNARVGPRAKPVGGGTINDAVAVVDGGDDAVLIHDGDLPVGSGPDGALHRCIFRKDVGDLLPGLTLGQDDDFVLQGNAFDRLDHEDLASLQDRRILL